MVVPIRLILDRLLHASDASDARSSITQLQDRVRISNNEEQQRNSDIMELVREDTFVSIMCQLIGNSHILEDEGEGESITKRLYQQQQQQQRAPLYVEDGSIIACDLLLNLLASSEEDEQQQQQHAESTASTINSNSSRRRHTVEHSAAKALLSSSSSTADIVSSLVDVLTNKTTSSSTSSGTSTYGRVLSMKLLSRLFALQPSMTQSNLIHKTPHGLNRLVDLLDVSEEERIRNEVLVLLITALSKSTSANTFRQMLLFAEGIEKALQIAVTSEDVGGCGGLSTKINEVVILDCTTLILSILQMGGAAPDILLGSTSSLNALAQLCDGRKGKRFLYKEYNINNNTTQQSLQQHHRMSMDDLLSTDVSNDLSLVNANKLKNTNFSEAAAPIGPILTKYEDLIIKSCLNIVLFCISVQQDDDENNEVNWKKIMSRRKIIAGNRGLMGIIKCWALYQPPTSSKGYYTFVASAPGEGTQEVALQILSTLCSGRRNNDGINSHGDTTTQPLQEDNTSICDMVDRLVPIYNPNTTTEDYYYDPITYKLLDLILHHPSLTIIAAAISALRSCMTEEQASIMVLHALAPPPPSPEEEEEAENYVLPTSPVQSLIDVLASHLLLPARSDDTPTSSSGTYTRKIQGAAAALGVILQIGGRTCKEMLLKIPISSAIVDDNQQLAQSSKVKRSLYLLPTIASWLEDHTNAEKGDMIVVIVRASLLRLICDWSTNCQHVVVTGTFSSISDPISIVNFLFTGQNNNNNVIERGLAALLLGLWMEFIGDAEHAGWSRTVILNLVRSKLGLSQFTELLESTKEEQRQKHSLLVDSDKNKTYWWTCNEKEQKFMLEWFSNNVDMVRRRLVQEITGTGTHQDSLSSDGVSSNNNLLLSALVEQQAAELEALRKSLKETSINLTLTTSECRQWRARCESSSLSDTDAIAEQIEISIKAQQEAMSLREELDIKDAALKALQDEKESVEQKLQSKIDQLQQETDAAAQENETMSQELQSLSQAYYILEEEIRRLKSASSDVILPSHPHPKGEDAALTVITSSVVANESSSHLESLQLELQDLRDRIRAADEWMAMAVDRMNAMATENEVLVSQLQQNSNQVQARTDENSTLRQLSEKISSERDSSTSGDDHLIEKGKTESRNVEEVIENLRRDNLEAQEWMSKAVTYNQYLSGQNEELNSQIDALNARVITLEQEISAVKDDKERAVEELRQELEIAESELENMKCKLEDYNSSSNFHGTVSNSQTLNKDLMLRKNSTEDQDGTLNATTHNELSDSQVEMLSLQVRELEQRLLAVIAEKENMTNELKRKLESADSDLALLQGKLDDSYASPSSLETEPNSSLLHEELLALRKSNAEAQEWMSNAVLHHEYLSGEIQELTSKNHTLEKELVSFKKLEANQTKTDELLRGQIQELAARNDTIMEEVAALRNEREIIMNGLMEIIDMDDMETPNLFHGFEESVSAIKSQKRQLQLDIERLTINLEDATSSYIEANNSIALLKDQIARHEKELALYRAELNPETADLSGKRQEYEAKATEGDLQSSPMGLHSKILEHESSSVSLQERLSELKTELTTAESQIKMLLESERNSQLELLAANEEIAIARAECVRVGSDLQNVTDAFEASKTKLAAMEELIDEKNLLIESEQQRVKALDQENDSMRESFETLQNNCDELTSKLETTAARLEESRNEVRTLEERLQMELETRLANEEAIRSLKVSIKDYQDAIEKKQKELDRFRLEWEEDIAASKESMAQSQGKILELQTQLNQAEMQYSEKMKNADMEISNLQYQLQEKAASLITAEEELSSMSTKLQELAKQSSAAVTQWKERCDTLEETVKELQGSLHTLEYDFQQLEKTKQKQLDAANDAIALWEVRCEELTNKIEEVGEQSSDVVNQWKERSDVLESTVEELQDALQTLESKFQQLERTKEEQLNSANYAIAQWEGRCAELTLKIQEIQESYERSQAEWLDGAISELQEEVKRLMALNDDLNSELTVTKDLLHSVESERYFLQQQAISESKATEEARVQLTETLNQRENSIIELQARIGEISSALGVSEEKLSSAYQTIEIMQDRARQLDKERDDFQIIIAQLQSELREAYETLQSKVTDDLSDKAFEKATQILNSQLEEFRSKLNDGRDELQKERDGRLLAEQSLEELKRDIAFLAESDGNFKGNVDEKLKVIASKAADCKARKERKAIEELSNIIEKTTNELTASKCSEREAVESLEANQLELLMAKKDIESFEQRLSTMQQMIDKTRGEHLTTMSLLRSRVCRLEEEQSRATRIHEEQISRLKEQLSHAAIEKDQLLRSLREVEGSYSALVSARNSVKNGELNDEESEVTKLSIEKSELLFALSDAATKTEQRLRSLVAVQTSTHETELMIERELRQALETSLEEKENELNRLILQVTETERLKSQAEEEQKKEAFSHEKDIQTFHSKLERLTSDFNSLTKANRNLTEELSSLSLSNQKLLDKCRKSEIEVRKLKEQKQFDADIASEIARLKAEYTKSSNNSNGPLSPSSTLGSHNNNEFEHIVSVEGMYYLILDLRNSVKEERDLYHNLLLEHEDLLSIFAQLDLERSKLQVALATFAGQSAVDDAIRAAEETAVMRFGEITSF